MTGRERARRLFGVDSIRDGYKRDIDSLRRQPQDAKEQLEAWAMSRRELIPPPPDWEFLWLGDSRPGWRPIAWFKVQNRHETPLGSVGMVVQQWFPDGRWIQWLGSDLPYGWVTNAEIGQRPEVLLEAISWFSRKEPPRSNILTHVFGPRLLVTTEAVPFYALEISLEHFPPGAPPPDVFAHWLAEHMDQYLELRIQAMEAGLPSWTAGLPDYADWQERPQIWRPSLPPVEPMPADFPRPGLRRGAPRRRT